MAGAAASAAGSTEPQAILTQLKLARTACGAGLIALISGTAIVLTTTSRSTANVGYALMSSGMLLILFAGIKSKSLTRQLRMYEAQAVTNMTVGHPNQGYAVSPVPGFTPSPYLEQHQAVAEGIYPSNPHVGSNHPGEGQYPPPGAFSSAGCLPPAYALPGYQNAGPPPSYTEAMEAAVPTNDHISDDQGKATSPTPLP